ncbi:putative pyrophosphatase/phosphodiesterase [Ceratocystis lukuohia]|uniref:Pyrophosphatase/phosphodiesterase n=1 Tax=Ceratocystis lukuohia TaxID=2019550 RepID=A0ABR4M9J8_9PEZI
MPIPPRNSDASTDLGPDSHDSHGLLSPIAYDDDAASLHSAHSGRSARSDQDSDSSDDELQIRARNSSELRLHDQLVLHEEEELETLVQHQRRKQNRRPSALAPLTKPLAGLFRNTTDARSSSSLSLASSSASAIDPASEKRTMRRARRQRKKNRLLENAVHGEDGELMYEMEEGGFKDGSSTASSSDHDDREDLLQRRMARGKALRASDKRSRCLAIGAVVAVAVLAVGIFIWSQSSANSLHPTLKIDSKKLVSNGTALFAPTTIIVSLDGFRADFLQRGLTPRLKKFIKEGVSPKYMNPSFPSVTFPNHYTLATGLYPEAHGIVGNTFWDPELKEEFYYTDPERSLNPKWWDGEPFWVTAEKAGIRTGVHMWPGSEAHIGGIEPSFLDKFNGDEPLDNKVARVLEFLDKPGAEAPDVPLNETRAQLIAFYVPNVDADGHKYGPNSTEIRSTISDVDMMLDKLFHGLEQRNLTDIVNIIVVSDHGMATTDTLRVLQLDDLVDLSKVAHQDGWPLVGLRLHDEAADLQSMYEALRARAIETDPPAFDVYLRDGDMPERYHFTRNPRIAPLWLVPRTGWAIATRDEFDVAAAVEKGVQFEPRGLHGYDNENPLMRAIFVARGPAFPHPGNSEVAVFQNTEVYNLVCRSVGLTPMPNNATLQFPLQVLGSHAKGNFADLDEDPEDSLQTSTPIAPAASSEATTFSKAESPSISTPTTPVSTEPIPVPDEPASTESAPTTSIILDAVPTSTIPAASSVDSTLAESTPSETPPSQTQSPQKGATDSISSFWNWITDKVNNLTGGNKDGGDDGEGNDEKADHDDSDDDHKDDDHKASNSIVEHIDDAIDWVSGKFNHLLNHGDSGDADGDVSKVDAETQTGNGADSADWDRSV